MNNRTCYLAAPIDFANPEVQQARHFAKKLLQSQGWTVYDPAGAWSVSGTPLATVQAVNGAVLAHCGAVLALLPDDVTTIGVPMEISDAVRHAKPIAVVGGERAAASWALAGVKVFDDPADAIMWLDGQFEVRVHRSLEQTELPLSGYPVSPLPRESAVVRFFKLTEAAIIPKQAYPGDAGVDLHLAEGATFEPGEHRDIPVGLRMKLPHGHWAMIVGRSSTLRNRRLLVTTGIIDTGYEGELFVGATNMSKVQVTVDPSDRLAQLILLPNHTDRVVVVESDWVTATAQEGVARGGNGFGSSGR